MLPAPLDNTGMNLRQQPKKHQMKLISANVIYPMRSIDSCGVDQKRSFLYDIKSCLEKSAGKQTIQIELQ